MMKHGLNSLLFVSSLLLCLPASAVTVYKCQDASGAVTFQDRCPPGTEVLNEKKLRGDAKKKGTDLESVAAQNPITLYTVPDCDACDLVRIYLEKKAFPFTEKNVADDFELQDELKNKSGALTVPVLIVGAQSISGYDKPAMEGALEQAGYPVKEQVSP